MTYEEAKQTVTNVLNNQRLTIQEHTQLQQAWGDIVRLSDSCNCKESKDANDAIPVSGAIQAS